MCDPQAKVVCQLQLVTYCIFLQESWHPLPIYLAYSYVMKSVLNCLCCSLTITV